MKINNLFKDFDCFISKIGLFISILSILYTQYFLTGRIKYFSITLLVGVSVTLFMYMLLRERLTPEIPQVKYMISKSTYFKISVFLYIFLYSQSIYMLSQHIYTRPLLYFIVVAFICALVVLQTQLFSKGTYVPMVILFEILLISLNLRWGIIYEFPSIIGIDPISHLNIAMQIVNSGKIPLGNQYSAHPIIHIFISVVDLLTNLSSKNSLVFSVGFEVAVLLPIFTYIICKKTFTVKIALISALFVAISNYLIWYGYILFATSVGLVYFIILLFFIYSPSSPLQKTLSILFFIIIVLSHPLTNVVFLFSVTLLLLLQVSRSNLLHDQIKTISVISINIIVLFFSFTLTYWMYSVRSSDRYSFFYFVVKTLVTKLTTFESIPSTLSTSLGNVTALNEILNTLGAVSVLCLGIIGALHIIRIKSNSFIPLYLVLSGFFVFSFAAGFQIIGFENILPERWFGFAYLLFAVPASVGFQLIHNININKKFVICIQSIMIFIIAFLLITSSIANMDTPIYSKNISLRTGFFESELAAVDFFGMNSNTTFVTDMRYQPMRAFDNRGIRFLGLVPFVELLPNDIVIIREYVLNNRFECPAKNPNGSKSVIIDPNFLYSLELDGVNKIYTNEIVNMYLIR